MLFVPLAPVANKFPICCYGIDGTVNISYHTIFFFNLKQIDIDMPLENLCVWSAGSGRYMSMVSTELIDFCVKDACI